MRYLFVGERPSVTAARMGVTLRDGRLAAKQLFDALRACGLAPEAQEYENVYRPRPTGPEVVCRRALGRVRRAAAGGRVVVALGRKAAAELARAGVPHLAMVHPAARGRIRKKERYAAHVRGVLLGDRGKG